MLKKSAQKRKRLHNPLNTNGVKFPEKLSIRRNLHHKRSAKYHPLIGRSGKSAVTVYLSSLFKLFRKTSKHILLGLIFLTVILSLILIKNAYFSIKNAIWDGTNQIVFAFEQENKIGVVEIDPKRSESVVVTFPDNTYFPLALGYQTYRADKIKSLAVLEGLSLGTLLTKSMTLSLGLLTQSAIVDLKGDKPILKSIIWQSLLNPQSTSFTAWDKVRLLVTVLNLKIDEINIINAADEFLKKETTPDGSEAYSIDDTLLTSFVLSELSNPEFLQEKMTWEIYNATNRDRLADSMRRITANSGFDVTGIRQAQEFKDKSVIYIIDESKLNDNILRFADFFKFTIKVDPSFTPRSDVALYLGEDYWQEYFTNR